MSYRPTMTPSSVCRRRRLVLSAACWLFLTSVVDVSAFSENRKNPVSGQLSQKDLLAVNQAIQATKQAAGNITAAFEACNRWNQVLMEKDPSKSIPESIRAMCYPLQASCLVRTGQDEEAIQVYDKAMQLKDLLNEDTREDVILGKAYSFQRLMKYDAARDQFQLSTSSKAARGAATCALRLGDMDAALVLLEERQNNERDLETTAMLATIQYLMSAEPSLEESNLNLLREAGAFFPLYRWIHMALSKGKTSSKNDAVPHTSPLDLAALNTCAFDDPFLMHLDDKVLSHKLLCTQSLSSSITSLPTCEAFWPPGLILPAESANLSQSTHLENVRWVCKKRAGYGSHGNAIVDTQEAIKISKSMDTGALQDELLLQRMIEPCLLLRGYKFSLRIYVVYFGASTTSSTCSPDMFISTQGLVKLAARPFDDQSPSLDLGMHMTNSGREAFALQEDLQFLQREFSQAGWSYNELWNDITGAVRNVMRTYDEKTRSMVNQDDETVPSRSRVAKLGLPKILGFDFIVDETRNVWLLEVNRFPGMEARDSKDASVKRQVIRDAWQMAGRRVGCDNDSWLKATLSDIDCSDATSLERIDL
jgi:tetratricopeptide (TPR) repeat protein